MLESTATCYLHFLNNFNKNVEEQKEERGKGMSVYSNGTLNFIFAVYVLMWFKN